MWYNRRNYDGLKKNIQGGLIHLWELEDNYVDSVGNWHFGLSGSVPFSTGKVDRCADFNANGYTGHLSMSPGSFNYLVLTSWTASFWVYPRAAKLQGILCEWRPQNSANHCHGFRLRDNNIAEYANSNGVGALSTAKVTLNYWNHVVFRGGSDAGAVSERNIFINNVKEANNGIVQLGFPNDVPLEMGTDRYSASVRALNGMIDQVAMWDRLLTDDEINLLYGNGNGISLV